MSNTILTHQMIAREGAKMLSEELAFIKNVNTSREDDATAKVNGYRKGGTLKIKIPPPSKVYDGATFAGGGSADDQIESYVTLSIATQKHVPMTFTAVEKALSIDEFKDRFLKPAISTLASYVEADLLSKIYLQCPNVVGTAGSVPNSAKVYSQARAAMQRFLAPGLPRTMLFSSDANVELVDASKALFNPNPEVSKMFRSGLFAGQYADFNFFEHQSLPVHTNGNKVSGVLVDGASQVGSTLNVKSVANADTFKKGTVFTIAGVYAVHPLTGVSTGVLRQFVITADKTMTTTTGSLSIYPAIDATAPGVTCSASPADGAAITIIGAASTGYRQNLGWQRDAIACAFAPLSVLVGCEGYTFDADGISLRVMTFGDGKADTEGTRIDVLYADPMAVRPDHIVRVTE